ncbi:Ig-like domain-containing protein [Calidifontibacillus oryziterrae]|uniref:Ig-like domain-containing protein n=1 Tax=Calidifontibacillus oryziterrae TaxID=1191699 RepID=UPI0002FB9036|nr:Ig-like domain-containing protein [Calidifontibacillus oryziterrae]
MVSRLFPKVILVIVGLLLILTGCRDKQVKEEVEKYLKVNANISYEVLPSSSLSSVSELVKEYDQSGNLVNSDSSKFNVLYTVTPELLKKYDENKTMSDIYITQKLPKGVTILNPEVVVKEEESTDGKTVYIPLSNIDYSPVKKITKLKSPKEPNIPQTFPNKETNFILNGGSKTILKGTLFSGETKLTEKYSFLHVFGPTKFDGNIISYKENSNVSVLGNSLFNGETRLQGDDSYITITGDAKFNGNTYIQEKRSAITVTGDSIFNGETNLQNRFNTISITGDAEFNGNTLIKDEGSSIHVLGDALFNGETKIEEKNSRISILGNAKFEGNISLEKGYSKITVYGNAQFNNQVELKEKTSICVFGTAYYTGSKAPFTNKCGRMAKGDMSNNASNFTPQTQTVQLQLQVDHAIDEPLKNAFMHYKIEDRRGDFEDDKEIAAPSENIKMIVKLTDSNRNIDYMGDHLGNISKFDIEDSNTVTENVLSDPISEMKFENSDAEVIRVKDMNNKEKLIYLSPKVVLETDKPINIDPTQTEPYEFKDSNIKLYIDPEKKILPTDKVSYRYSIDGGEEVPLDESTIINLVDGNEHRITVTATGGFATGDAVTFKVKCTGLLFGLKFIDGINKKIMVGEKLSLGDKIVFDPEDYPNKNVAWDSSNKSVANIDTSGNVTGISTGITTITVLSLDSDKSDTIEIEVLPYVKLQGAPKYITLGTTVGLEPYLIRKPTETPVSWNSSNINVISINDDGVITAKAIGYSDITVKSVVSGSTSTVRIYVQSKGDTETPSLDLKW